MGIRTQTSASSLDQLVCPGDLIHQTSLHAPIQVSYSDIIDSIIKLSNNSCPKEHSLTISLVSNLNTWIRKFVLKWHKLSELSWLVKLWKEYIMNTMKLHRKIYNNLLSSQSVDCGSYKLYLCEYLCVCVCRCVCVCVCATFTAYISITVGRILIKLGEYVWNLV